MEKRNAGCWGCDVAERWVAGGRLDKEEYGDAPELAWKEIAVLKLRC